MQAIVFPIVHYCIINMLVLDMRIYKLLHHFTFCFKFGNVSVCLDDLVIQQEEFHYTIAQQLVQWLQGLVMLITTLGNSVSQKSGLNLHQHSFVFQKILKCN